MKINTVALSRAKAEIASLIGKKISVSINVGRGKFEDYLVEVCFAYPSVFVLAFEKSGEKQTMKTYSYNDILCGIVKLL